MECPPSELGKITAPALREGAKTLDVDLFDLERASQAFPTWVEENNEELRDNEVPFTDAYIRFSKDYFGEVDEADVYVWYGVMDGSGMEWFVDEDSWWNMEDHIRHGSYRWWLDWCRNGGRHGSSQPFSIYLTKKQGQGVIKALNDKDKEIREKAMELLMKNPSFAFLYPWSQHNEVIKQNALRPILERGDNPMEHMEEAQENFVNEMSNYATQRQKIPNVIRWPKGFRFL